MSTISVLNINQFEQDTPLSNFYSSDLKSHLNKNKVFFSKPHSHDFFLCVIFSKGSGIHEIDFNSYPINAGSVFFLKPGQTHFWKFTSNPEGYIFFHTKDFYELHFTRSRLEQFPFYYSHENTPLLELSIEKAAMIKSKFKNLNEEYNKDLLYHKQKISSLINIIYIDLSREYGVLQLNNKMVSNRYVETLRALEELIDRHYKTQKSAKFYANQLNMSTKHLNRVIKSILGKTTTNLIIERVLLESKRLVVHSKEPLSVIAELLGYDDYAYFSRVFKQKTNMTPMDFKRQY
ncbi:AraC family transcriptional regulator [uncultured Algibacter sp.]|uniref:AraC family transcriptional regulator n=1 Tax=uncultured Algibacter sp. TaxID=298659 RepID=UPI0026143C58|nr:AraC family transcriptional regulator [uncultured Algibacter sp.]